MLHNTLHIQSNDYNAGTNTPALATATGYNDNIFQVTTQGIQTINGVSSFCGVGDEIIVSNGASKFFTVTPVQYNAATGAVGALAVTIAQLQQIGRIITISVAGTQTINGVSTAMIVGQAWEYDGNEWLNIANPFATQAQVFIADPLIHTTVTANLMNFQQQGTGAVLYPLVSKMQQVVSVKDFGAVGDGVADDTAAIQSAVDSGAKVINLLSNGIYKVTSKIELPDNITINGCFGIINSQSSTLVGGTGIFTIDGGGANTQKENINLLNIQFVGKATFDEQKHQIAIHGGKNINIENCYFNGFPGDAIYINGGDGYRSERHNYNISITNNFFNGVNYENRNAISILDCNGLIILGNKFINCSRVDMPGCIDIEPNPGYAYAVIFNIIITNNIFTDNKGSNGEVSVVLFTALTTPPGNIVIANNMIKSLNAYSQSIAFYCVVPNAANNFCKVIGNTSNYGCTISQTSQLSYLDISNNSFSYILAPLTTGSLSFIDINNNFLSSYIFVTAPSATAINNVKVSGNTVNQAGYTGPAYGINVKANSSSITNNTVVNSFNVFSIFFHPSLGSSCRFYGNSADKPIGNTSWLTDDCGDTVNGITATTFNTGTPPSSFASGTSVAMLNGDTGVPSGIGSTIGRLETIVTTNTGGYAQTIYQIFYPYYTTASVARLWVRQAINGTTWTLWRENGITSNKIASGLYATGNSTVGTCYVQGVTDYNGRTTSITITTPILNSNFSTTLVLNPAAIATALGLTPPTIAVGLTNPGSIANTLSSGALSTEYYIFETISALTPNVWNILLSGSLVDSARHVAFTFSIIGTF